MSKLICSLTGMCFLAVALAALAQSGDTMKQNTMNQGGQMKQETMAKKAVTVTGKVSDDGKMLTSGKDNKMWTVTNPEALKGHEGHQITVKAHVDAAKNEIHVVSVKMAKGEMKDTMKKDEMQH